MHLGLDRQLGWEDSSRHRLPPIAGTLFGNVLLKVIMSSAGTPYWSAVIICVRYLARLMRRDNPYRIDSLL